MIRQQTAPKMRLPLALVLVLLVAAGFQSTTGRPFRATAGKRHAAQALPAGGSADALANCRYGVTGAGGTIAALGAGWYYLFDEPFFDEAVPGSSAELVHLIKVLGRRSETGVNLPGYDPAVPLDAKLADFIRQRPGGLWLVGNEVDRGPAPGEIDPNLKGMLPATYAQAYHDLYTFIKGNDPTARVAISGLVEVTPGRRQYLDLVWDAYLEKYGAPMPVDVWNMHLYIFPEVAPNGSVNKIAGIAMGTDPALGIKGSGKHQNNCPQPGSTADPQPGVYCFSEHDDMRIFAEQVVAMREWMKAHGQQQKPLILSEYSLLYWYMVHADGSCTLADEFGNCFTPERVTRFLRASFDYLNQTRDPDLGYTLDGDRLVQAWNWYTIHSKPEAPSDLVRDGAFTPAGLAFREHVAREQPVVDLVAEGVSGKVVAWQQGLATAELAVTFRNSGNAAIVKPFSVAFYRDAAREERIGAARVTPLVRGCGLAAYKATVSWPGLAPGNYPFWAVIDSENEIGESPPGPANNTISGLLTVEEVPLFTLTVDVINQGQGSGGSVAITPEGPTYEAGTAVTLTAIPNAGWNFTHWDGDWQSPGLVARITMDRDKHLRAHFRQETYELDVRVVGRGQILVEPDQETYVFGDVVTLTAQAKEGWRFAHWSGDVKEPVSTSTIALTMTGNLRVVGTFMAAKEIAHLPLIR